MKKKDVKKMVGMAILLTLVIVLQLISGVLMKFGLFSMTFCLIPIVIGGIIYGVKVGTILGFSFGIMTIFNALIGLDAGTLFMLNSMGGYTCVMTIVLCIVKATMAGLVPALAHKAIKNKNNNVACVVSAILCPVTNTGIFAIGFPLFLMAALKSFADGENAFAYLFLSMIGVNFIIELGVTVVFSPVVYRIKKIYELNYSD